MHINTCIDKMLPLVESRGSDVDICDKVSPDILQQIPTLTVVFGSGGHHLRKCWLLIGSRPSPTFFRPSPTFFPHRHCRHQNASILVSTWAFYFTHYTTTHVCAVRDNFFYSHNLQTYYINRLK